MLVNKKLPATGGEFFNYPPLLSGEGWGEVVHEVRFQFSALPRLYLYLFHCSKSAVW